MSVNGTILQLVHCTDVFGSWVQIGWGGTAARYGVCAGTGDAVNRLFRRFGTTKTTQSLSGKFWSIFILAYASTPRVILAVSSGTTPLLGVQVYNNSGNNYLRLVRWNVGGASWDVLATSAPMATGNARIDMRVENYGASANVTVLARYFNTDDLDYGGPHQPVLTFSGDVRSTGYTNFDGFTMARSDIGASPTGALIYSIGAGIASDEIGTVYELVDQHLTGVDDTNTMAAGTSADLAKNNDDTTTTVDATAAGQKILGNCASIYANARDVIAVDDAALMRCGTSGPQTAHIGQKSGATESWDSALTLSNAWQNYQSLKQVNPATGVAYTVSEVNARKLGIKADT